MEQDGDVAGIQRALADLMRVFSSDRAHAERVEACGTQITQTNLRFLGQVVNWGPISVSRLAQLLDLSQPTTSRCLRQLEQDGLVARGDDPTDRRIVVVSATAEGRELHERVSRYRTWQLTRSLEGLSAQRRHDIAESLTELVHRLQRADPIGLPDQHPASTGTNASTMKESTA